MSELDLDQTPDLNITPLVDIMLVLLAILMVTIPSVIYEEEINLPKASQKQQLQKQPQHELVMSRSDKVIECSGSTISFNGQNYPMNSFADSFMMSSANIDKGKKIYIRADKDLKYEDVMYILKVLKEAGFSKVSLITDG